MPSGAFKDGGRIGTGFDTAGDSGEVGVHRRGVDQGQGQPCRSAARRAGCAK